MWCDHPLPTQFDFSLSLSLSLPPSLSFSPAAEDHIPRRAPSPQLAHHWEVESKRLSSGSTPSPRATKKKARPRSMAFLIEPNQTFEPVKKEATPSQPLQRRSKCCISGTDILGGRRVGNFQGIQFSWFSRIVTYLQRLSPLKLAHTKLKSQFQ